MKLGQLLRHRWVDARDARRVLGDDGEQRLEERIRASELQHSGEIRVCIEAGLPLADLWHEVTARERALAVFGELRIWDTEANNGVLIYLLLADHAIEIVADRGVERHVEPGHWPRVLASMEAAFRAGRFEQGLAGAIDAVHAVLVERFPVAPGARNVDELPNDLVILN